MQERRYRDRRHAFRGASDASTRIQLAKLDWFCATCADQRKSSDVRATLVSVTDTVLPSLLDGLRPMLPLLAVVGVLLLLLSCPLPGRGPRMFQRRDTWRGFRFAARRAVLDRAGGRCEGPVVLAWGRCRAQASEVDHVYPWSRGGPTIVSNGQALCRAHNKRKSNLRPPWWYVLSLERRRAGYLPPGTEARVLARMNADERAARIAWTDRRR